MRRAAARGGAAAPVRRRSRQPSRGAPYAPTRDRLRGCARRPRRARHRESPDLVRQIVRRGGEFVARELALRLDVFRSRAWMNFFIVGLCLGASAAGLLSAARSRRPKTDPFIEKLIADTRTILEHFYAELPGLTPEERKGLCNVAIREVERTFREVPPWTQWDFPEIARQAEALGYDAHPYDPMVAIFEPGESAASMARAISTWAPATASSARW